MKFKEWWAREGEAYTQGMDFPDYPAASAAVREASYQAWLVASREGRHTAAKGGPLFNGLRKCGLSHRQAGKVTKTISKWLLG